jgi:hypothetical protein
MNPERSDSGREAGPPAGQGIGDCAERLSSLLDGELDADACRALVERLRHDESACRQWMLFNCVGDAMRSADVAAWHSDRFVGRVSAALEREPTVLAPAAKAPRAGTRRWLLPGAGAAVAAAILIAIGLPPGRAPVPEVNVATAPLPVTKVAAAGGTAQIERSPALERYLAAHRELAAPTVMPSSTPYVRTSAAMPASQGR